MSLCVAPAAAQWEPLVVSKMTDPDPHFIPLPPEQSVAQQSAARDEQAKLDEAMQDFGRAIGQAGMIQQQQLDARCRTGAPASATVEQRYAWAASCRYTRR